MFFWALKIPSSGAVVARPKHSFPASHTPIVAGAPASVTITTPNADDLEQQSQLAISRATGFCVIDNASYIEAGERFNAVVGFINSVTEAFKEPKALAYNAHRSISALESRLLNPAAIAKDHLATQLFAYRKRLEAARIAEEQRIQREQQALALAIREREQASLDAEVAYRQKLIDEAYAKSQDEALPWEQDDLDDPVTVERVILPEPEIAPVRLPSSVPVQAGGPVVRKKPFAGRIVDFRKLVIEAGKRAEAGDDSLINSGVLQVNVVKLNDLAREHQFLLKDVFPGTEAFQEETLVRG